VASLFLAGARPSKARTEPSCVSFVFSMDDHSTDVPTTRILPRERGATAPTTVIGTGDRTVLGAAAEIFAYGKKGSKAWKERQRARASLGGGKFREAAGELHGAVPRDEVPVPEGGAPAAATATAAAGPADEEDIFGDAGTDYVPTAPKARAPSEAAGSYDVPRPPAGGDAGGQSYDVPRPPAGGDAGGQSYDVPRPPAGGDAGGQSYDVPRPPAGAPEEGDGPPSPPRAPRHPAEGPGSAPLPRWRAPGGPGRAPGKAGLGGLAPGAEDAYEELFPDFQAGFGDVLAGDDEENAGDADGAQPRRGAAKQRGNPAAQGDLKDKRRIERHAEREAAEVERIMQDKGWQDDAAFGRGGGEGRGGAGGGGRKRQRLDF